MKHIQIRFILCATFVLLPFFMKAQTTAQNETDSMNIEKQDSMVQVAFREVSKDDLLGGVSVVNVEDLLKKNYHTYSLESMEGYIGGWNGNSLWGMDDHLVLVDGVPRAADNILPTEIDEITFLKGASAVVLYGSRAAKGVINITTKRGKDQPLEVNVRANTGFHVSKSYPKYLGSAEYMTLFNEASVNDGKGVSFSDEDIFNHASANNPYRYPDVDFYSSDYLQKAYNRTDVTTELIGGNDRAQYYSNIGYSRTGDVLNFGEAANNYDERLNIRGNVDIKLNDFIDAHVNANATFYSSRGINYTDSDPDDDENVDNYWTYASTMRPNRVAPLIPTSYIDKNALSAWPMIDNSLNIVDGQYFLGGSRVAMTNAFADAYAGGYNKYNSRQFQFDTGLDFDLQNLMDGLSFHTLFAVDYSTSYNASYSNEYAVFVPSWYNYNGEDVIAELTQEGSDEKSGEPDFNGEEYFQTIAFSGWFDYATTINDTHNISAMLVANGYQQTQSEVYHSVANANVGIQLGYNMNRKYYVDLGGSVVHSAKFAEGNRNAFSPSATLGWRLSQEDFLSGSSVVDDLMLSVSGSVLHTDMSIEGFYEYAGNFNQSDGAWWGWYDGASERSTNSIQGENEDLTFVKRKELSANLRTSLWKNTITADASFFINTMEGLITEPMGVFPNYFFTYYPEASFVPNVNFNDDQRTGLDFSVKYKESLGDVDLTLGVSGTYYTTEATKRDDIAYENDYQKRQGKAVDAIWGLENAGFFQNQADVDNSPTQTFGGNIKPGDLKYVDQNNDGVIDEKDEIFLGQAGWYGNPFTMGVNITAKWKNFTFFALGTGYFGAYAMKDDSYHWVYGDRKYSEVVRGRWTPETNGSATFPRLTTESGSNNFRNSDFWLYSTDRFNIAKVQITYDLPKSVLQNIFFKEFSAYIGGSNLLTISPEQEILEREITEAPQTRFYNIGVKAVF
ncbi:TonB-linked SusC/RagA family outer membrane protein [Marinilabilia salmonicolor]|jgi:TonB-linked SusC/RagA family outer membrane protein|nr:TonB-linked SusC/RagA family outer membrane protein [Marinilabilia salmonicolor]